MSLSDKFKSSVSKFFGGHDPGQEESGREDPEPAAAGAENAAESVAPADAPREPDEPAEPDDDLGAFIDDFLKPIAADGELDKQLEETPLIVAFHAYGVANALEKDFDAVDARVREAIQAATGEELRKSSRDELTRARERILRQTSKRSSKLTKTELTGLHAWFVNEAKELGHSVDFPLPEGKDRYREESLDRTCVTLFHKYFREVQAAGEMPDAVPEAGPPPDRPPQEVTYRGLASYVACSAVLENELPEQLRQEAPNIVARMEELLQKDGVPGLAFDSFRSGPGNRAVVVSDLNQDANLWFVGDVHGDLLGLECVFQYVDSYPTKTPACVVLMGDLFDDGRFSYEVLLRVYQRILEKPQQICVLTGNHDESLEADDELFRSTVWPSTFTDFLNGRVEQGDEVAGRLGRVTAQFFQQTPRALFLPDGLLVAHGGVVHSDLQETLTSREALDDPRCLQDFVWTRLHERARRKSPNRTTRGCEVGREDFERFCQKSTDVIGQPVTRMVRGHDHVDTRARYSVFGRYVKNPVLTLNTMCFRLPREAFGPYDHVPCIGRWVPGALPEVHQIQIAADAINRAYPMDEQVEPAQPEEDT